MGTRLKILKPLLDTPRRIWEALRQVSGDDGYERYLAHHTVAHPDIAPLSRALWFAREQQQKWTGVKRCC